MLDLTIGPLAFFWSSERVRDLYRQMAAAPVARVVIGEWVCSKRLPFWQDEIPGAIDTLLEAGKATALSTLAMVTLKRERRLTQDLLAAGLPVEINDLTGLRHIPPGTEFWVGPMVNVYNEGTLAWLADRGATRICLPPELPMASIATLAAAGRARGVAIEVWGHGRVPLAISGRCYHARLHDRAKDNCQFICEADPEGRDVETLDDQAFLAVNGVQTLSHSVASVALQLSALADAGVSSLRLSPDLSDFAATCADYAMAVANRMSGEVLAQRLAARLAPLPLSDGFMDGRPGVEWSGAPGDVGAPARHPA